MSLEFYSIILALGSIGVFCGLLGVLLLSYISKSVWRFTHSIKYEYCLVVLAIISAAAVVCSLTYQLVYQTPVCELCWWQRIFLYPVSVIALVAFWFKTREAHVTVAILAAFGLFYASYHYYYHFQGFVLGNKLTIPCSYGGLLPACTSSPILVFGFVTIPFMAIMIFGSLLILSFFAYSNVQIKLSK